MKEYAVIVAASIAAIASLTTLVLNTRLTLNKINNRVRIHREILSNNGKK